MVTAAEPVSFTATAPVLELVMPVAVSSAVPVLFNVTFAKAVSVNAPSVNAAVLLSLTIKVVEVGVVKFTAAATEPVLVSVTVNVGPPALVRANVALPVLAFAILIAASTVSVFVRETKPEPVEATAIVVAVEVPPVTVMPPVLLALSVSALAPAASVNVEIVSRPAPELVTV